MLQRDGLDAASFGDAGSIPETFVFLGGASVFPDVMLRMVEQEVDGARTLRLNSLSELRRRAGRDDLIRKVFFDDRLNDQVLRDIIQLRAQMPGTDWVLAYRDPSVARRLLALRAETPRLFDILLLPMTLPIGPWSSMLRLVLAGQFVAAGDLLGPDIPGAHAPPPLDTAPPDTPTAEDRKHPSRGTSPRSCLTHREREVLAMVSEGGRNKSIAHKLSLSEHTVKLHLHNAITKIGARNRTEAATWFLSHRSGDGP